MGGEAHSARVQVTGLVGTQDQPTVDRYPDGVVFRVWSMFVRAIVYGAGLGMLVVTVATGVTVTQSGWGWLGALPAFLFFAGMAGAVVGTVAATGALIAVLVFAPFEPARSTTREGSENALPEAPGEHLGAPHLHPEVADRRAVVAGIGAAVLVGAGWIVFARSAWMSTSPGAILVIALVGAVFAGVMAWLSVRRSERALSG